MKTVAEKKKEGKQEPPKGDTLPTLYVWYVCSPNLQIEVDSKRSQKRWASSLKSGTSSLQASRALQAGNGSVFAALLSKSKA